MELRVRDIMTTDVRTIHRQAPMRIAIHKMQVNAIRHLPVVDDLGMLIGLVSKRDALRHLANALFGEIKQPGETPCEEVMVARPLTISPDATLQLAAKLLAENRYGCLPVVESKSQIVGIISVVDLLQIMAGEPCSISREAVASSE